MRHPHALPSAPTRLLATIALALLALSLLPAQRLAAKSSEWQDLAGTKFKGEPTEILGPFALFKTSSTTGRRVLLRGFPPETLLRLHKEIAAQPARAASWSEATGAATRDLINRALVVENKKLVPADLGRIPEPELLMLLFASHNDGESWTMLRDISAVYERIQRVYPGKLGAVLMGVRHSESEHRRLAIGTYAPWLVADLPTQDAMSTLRRFTPAEGAYLVLLSRNGTALFGTRALSLRETKKFADDLNTLLAALDSSNPRSWPDRFQYLDVTRPVDFATSNTGPLLLGDPLRTDGLRQRGIARIEARLSLAADGSIVDATLQPGSSIPEAMQAPLLNALQKQAAFLPAIDHGKAIASTYDYTFVIPPENKALAADTAWLNGEARNDIPLPSWLVLRPVKVEERDFSGVDHVASDDTVMLKALEVSNSKVSRASQMNAFNTDWFTDAGAGSVNPKEGDPQLVDGTALTWKRIAAEDGLVDFGENSDYSIGYAWTEFESPSDTDAWLGLGSDDGVRIWLNGELVNDRWIRRPSRLDDDVVPLRLKKGKNQILIKIQNATGAWSFIARLRTR